MLAVLLPSISFASEGKLAGLICSNNHFLSCISTTEEACTTSFTQSENTCNRKYTVGVDAGNNDSNSLALKFGQCVQAEFIQAAGINSDRFESCGKHLESTFSDYRDNAEKSLKLN